MNSEEKVVEYQRMLASYFNNYIPVKSFQKNKKNGLSLHSVLPTFNGVTSQPLKFESHQLHMISTSRMPQNNQGHNNYDVTRTFELIRAGERRYFLSKFFKFSKKFQIFNFSKFFKK